MQQFSIQNLGLTVPQQQKAQGLFTSGGTSVGFGERHEPLDGTNPDPRYAQRGARSPEQPKTLFDQYPGVGEYDISKDIKARSFIPDDKLKEIGTFGTTERKDPRREDWPGPFDTLRPSYTKGGRAEHSRWQSSARQVLDPKKLAEIRARLDGKGDSLGPGSYPVQKVLGGPFLSFGSRFETTFGTNHVKADKAEGPGPGSYKMANTVRVRARHPSAVTRTTFGTSGRNYIELPQFTPAPNKYQVAKFTEASHGYTIAQSPRSNEAQEAKQAMLPSPYSYRNSLDMAKQARLAKSILGGSLEPKKAPDNGNPGPGAYTQNPGHSIPSFVIFDLEKLTKPRRGEADKERRQRTVDVGPLSYSPRNPALYRTDNLIGNSIGASVRQDIIPRTKVPGAGTYAIKGEFEKSQERPKFHMGLKTEGFMGRNLDFPGAGEYETDVIPVHHSNVAHFIGTSVRSDLGVGKAYMYPGPGEYEADVDPTMDFTLRKCGTFGTTAKDTKIKKTFAPGPASYEIPSSVGTMPQYLKTEENKATKEAQEAALRARLEI